MPLPVPLPVRLPVPLLVGLLVAVSAGGCGDAAAPRPFAGGGPPAFDVNPASRAEVRTGGTLRWPLAEFPAQWNVHHADGSKSAVGVVVRAVLPVLMRADADAVPRPVPEYLLSARVTRLRPRQVVTYRLNPRARWSDGRPIGAADFAAQARALSGADPRFRVATVTGYRQIARVSAGPDPGEVRVEFAQPYADWRSLFSPLYPASAMATPAAFDAAFRNRMPVTAGPFRVGRIDRTQKTVTLVRDPAWWGRPAELDRIVFRAMDGGAMPGAFANDEIDLIDVGMDAAALRRVASVPGASVRRAGGPDWRQITLNAARPALADVRVRRAVTLAIDRRALARSDLAGLCWPARTLGSHFLVNTQPGYRDNSGALGRYDPAAARRLLDAAGWRRHGRYRTRGGRTLALRFVVPAGVPGAKPEGELTRAMLQRVGIRVDVRTVPADDLFDRYVAAGDFDLVPFTWLGTAYPLSALRSVFARPGAGGLQQNYARHGTAEIDAAMDRAGAAVAGGHRARALLDAADRLIWREATVLPLYQRPQIVAVRRGLANLGANGFYEPAYEDIGFTRP
ncbi:ABC transporter family substrate-binding protein [Actinomadura atramentaria]|uniref:ABC transporter family substrate-binding protein n=1 Tax=Actinomadura atramentaria TaxID=1990 RepID=UPI001F0A8B4C|nr:ABC transporter family substrate-binding protein [Actinomadura atramentaria]